MDIIFDAHARNTLVSRCLGRIVADLGLSAQQQAAALHAADKALASIVPVQHADDEVAKAATTLIERLQLRLYAAAFDAERQATREVSL